MEKIIPFLKNWNKSCHFYEWNRKTLVFNQPNKIAVTQKIRKSCFKASKFALGNSCLHSKRCSRLPILLFASGLGFFSLCKCSQQRNCARLLGNAYFGKLTDGSIGALEMS